MQFVCSVSDGACGRGSLDVTGRKASVGKLKTYINI